MFPGLRGQAAVDMEAPGCFEHGSAEADLQPPRSGDRISSGQPRPASECMYPAGMDFPREAGMVLVPTRFVWPYGGRIVYIAGSFTGWTQWPMTPVEGCPTVFQTICSLPPGFHQYKFMVDGEWRHDERQPFISSNIGTVNTILLTREPDYVPPVLGSSMDVDDAFQRMVRESDGRSPEAFPTLSEADLEISRHRVAVFMSTHKAYELLPESGKVLMVLSLFLLIFWLSSMYLVDFVQVIALDVDLPVKQAFHILHEQGICMAPLWNFAKGKFVGVISALDFILIMRELGSNGSNLTEEELETHTISAWKEAKSYLNSQIGGQGGSRQLVQAGPDDSLKDVALKILQNGVATVPILYSSSPDASNPHLLHLASLSGILKCICRFFKHSPSSLPILQLPIYAIPLGTWVPKIGEANRQPLAMLRPSSSLSDALNLLIQAQVSSIPIVDDNDSLLDVYSRSDITALAKDKIYAHINLDETTIHQALQYRDDPFSPYGSNTQRCFMCLRSDPLHKVLEKLSQPGVRRIVVVEAGSKHVEGIISLGDVFRFLMGS
ncbi:Sucrose nonfermenting 4-like protein [Striga hermonthica]|uniref:Sucrose nonfermenting 4-like protein n=1 Tax=Striga hermonthica TaxID=68872 RepID=A0A9N7MW51_STRHE|nr:Sucrose nonfermenting 4-like protein [Striga hermonthica]